MIAPRVALTARHVVDEIFAQFGLAASSKARHQLPFAVQLGLAEPSTGAVLRHDVVGFYYSEQIDITGLLLETEVRTGNSIVLPRLRALPPEVGEPITGVGFPKNEVVYDSGDEYRIRIKPSLTNGVVQEVHDLKRDGALISFPSFRTDARFDGGMSGGPVFDSNGHVCGVICSNLPPDVGGVDHVSYASTLWPSLGLTRHSQDGGETEDLYHLAKQGVIQVIDLRQITFEPGAIPDHTRIRTKPPP